MQSGDQHRALIDKYLNNTLSDREKHEFLRLLKERPDLKQQVLEEKRIVSALQATEKAQLKRHLKKVSSASSANPAGGQVRWWLAAASVIIFFTAGYLLFFMAPEPQDLYVRYYEPYPAVSIQRGKADQVSNPLMLYSRGHYEQAIEAFTASPIPDDKPLHYLYLGNAWLQVNDTDKAIQTFNILKDVTDDQILQQHAQWYLAMCYLKKEDMEKTKAILKEIIAGQSIYTRQAEELYEKLN